ncbi:MAG: hypothetical protein JWQ34_1518 [Mucilaginibacter sp.]|nr:hypothetical protein [Mucilaginibacter sp.]
MPLLSSLVFLQIMSDRRRHPIATQLQIVSHLRGRLTTHRPIHQILAILRLLLALQQIHKTLPVKGMDPAHNL